MVKNDLQTKPQLVRVAVDKDGQARFWPLLPGKEDYEDHPLDPAEALHWITGGGVPMEFACCDPKDKQTHHYEILLEFDGGVKTTTCINLTRI